MGLEDRLSKGEREKVGGAGGLGYQSGNMEGLKNLGLEYIVAYSDSLKTAMHSLKPFDLEVNYLKKELPRSINELTELSKRIEANYLSRKATINPDQISRDMRDIYQRLNEVIGNYKSTMAVIEAYEKLKDIVGMYQSLMDDLKRISGLYKAPSK